MPVKFMDSKILFTGNLVFVPNLVHHFQRYSMKLFTSCQIQRSPRPLAAFGIAEGEGKIGKVREKRDAGGKGIVNNREAKDKDKGKGEGMGRDKGERRGKGKSSALGCLELGSPALFIIHVCFTFLRPFATREIHTHNKNIKKFPECLLLKYMMAVWLSTPFACMCNCALQHVYE